MHLLNSLFNEILVIYVNKPKTCLLALTAQLYINIGLLTLSLSLYAVHHITRKSSLMMFVCVLQQQQLQAQHLSHGHAIPVPLTPHPAGLQPPLPPGASAASLLALSSALSHQLPLKDERKHHENNSEHQRGTA